MSNISNLIFNGVPHKVTSPYGNRGVIKTSAGNTNPFHEGTDYAATGTNKSLDQFAIEDGYVFAAAKSNSDGALYVWVIYPRVKLAMLHYHLASYSVKAGQKVTKGTKLGVTGNTGRSTGIHLHLGIRDLSKLKDVNKTTWDLLRTCPYVDPEKVAYAEAVIESIKTSPINVPQSRPKCDAATSFDKKLAKSYITTDNLNIRQGASTKKLSFGVLPKGTKCQCYGYYTNGTNAYGNKCKWLCVIANGITGFVCADYLK